jgi:hypothetical protein
VGIVWQGLHAQELQPQTIYAIKDAEEVRLVDDLSDEDRLPAFGLHLHAIEVGRVPLTELASRYYAVESPGAVLACHPSLLVGQSHTSIRLTQNHVVNGIMLTFRETRQG